MLKVSKILTQHSKKVIVDLINLSNYGRLLEEHVEIEYQSSPTEMQTATVRALLTATTGVVGRYKGSKTVTYKRPLVSTLLVGTPTFTVVMNYPFTFNELKIKLLNQYGLILENLDIATYKNSQETMINSFVFNESYPEIVDNKIELYVSPKSPRFCPSTQPSFIIHPVNDNGTDLDLLIPTTHLHPLHSLDN